MAMLNNQRVSGEPSMSTIDFFNLLLDMGISDKSFVLRVSNIEQSM